MAAPVAYQHDVLTRVHVRSSNENRHSEMSSIRLHETVGWHCLGHRLWSLLNWNTLTI